MAFKNKKKILIVCSNSDISGAPFQVINLFNYFRKKFNVAMILGGKGEILSYASSTKNIFLIKEMKSNINLYDDILSFIKLKNLIKIINPDLIHTHCSKASFLTRIINLRRRPLIYTIHGWGFSLNHKVYITIIIFFIEYVLKIFVNAFIFLNKIDIKKGSLFLGINKNKSYFINILLSKLKIKKKKSKKLTITTIARYSYQKDYKTFFQSVNGLGCNIQCIGHATNSKNIKNLAKKYCKDSYKDIKFLGNVHSISDFYNNTDIFVLTSLYEGMPACILEAMKIGLPIVSSNVGGIGQFITNNKNGYLLEPRNVIGFRKKIKKLLNNAGLRLKISVNNISKFKTQYSSKQVYSKTETIYRELLK